MIRQCGLVLALLAGIVPLASLSDPSQSAGDFFEPGFVAEGGQAEKSGATSANKAVGVVAPLASSNIISQGPKIISISLIIGGDERSKHLEPAISLIELCRDRNIPIGKIYSIGNIGVKDPRFDKLLIHLSVLGGLFEKVTAVPEKYAAVKSAPTWIVETEEGEILLEGVSTIEQFVTTSGELDIEKRQAPSKDGKKVETQRLTNF